MNINERIKKGLDGEYQGLANGLERTNKLIFGVQRSCYTLLGGLSGSAKTTLVDYMIINALEDAEAKQIPINVFYWCLEIDETTKKCNWLSVLIYKKYDRVITPEKIKGLGDNRLTDEELQLVEDVIPDLNKLFNKINWFFESTNPTGVYNTLWQFMQNRGKFEKEAYKDADGNSHERIIKFIPTNPEEYNIVVGDHLALFKTERGFTLKQNIDKLSEYSVVLRNLFSVSFYWLQQFNQSLNAIDRQKHKGVDISPSQTDFKDTTNPYTDADVVLGLMNAHQMDMDTCLGYSINKRSEPYSLKHRFRMLKIVKNRLSRDNVAVGLLFLAEAGSFEELPKPADITPEYAARINNLVNGNTNG